MLESLVQRLGQSRRAHGVGYVAPGRSRSLQLAQRLAVSIRNSKIKLN